MRKLDSVKKPKALISFLLKSIICISVLIFLIVVSLLVGAYFINGKNDVSNDLVFPIIRSFIIIFPIDLILIFIIFVLATLYHLVNKKHVVVKKADSLFELSRTTLIYFDETDIFQGKNCSVKEVVALSNKNKNEIIDIVGSIAFQIKNANPVIHSLQMLSYIPIFSDDEVNEEDNYYLANYKGQKYVLGENGSFKYRQEEFIKTKVEPYLLKGYEVLLVGSFEKDIKNGKYADFADVFGLIIIKNEVNNDYKDMVRYFQNRDVKVKVLSSGNAVMASQQANAVGVNNAGKFISLNSHSEINEHLVNEFSVFGGLSKKQKQQVITLSEKQGEVVTTFAHSEDTHNSNCVISSRDDINADVVLGKESSPMTPFREGVTLSNKIYRVFTLLLFKSLFVDLYLITSSILAMMGYSYNYKPVGLGVLFALLAGLSIAFDYERIEPPSLINMWRKVLISFGLCSLTMVTFFVMHALQIKGLLYTGIIDYNVYLSMCGITLIIGVAITSINLYIPINKHRAIILSIILAFIFAVTGFIWGLSYGLGKEILGFCFHKFVGQNIISLIIALFMLTSLYILINYLIDNYKERGEQ